MYIYIRIYVCLMSFRSSFKLQQLNQLQAGGEVRQEPCQADSSNPIAFSSHLFFQFLLPP